MGGASIARVDGWRIIEVNIPPVRNVESKRGGSLFSKGVYFREGTVFRGHSTCPYLVIIGIAAHALKARSQIQNALFL